MQTVRSIHFQLLPSSIIVNNILQIYFADEHR